MSSTTIDKSAALRVLGLKKHFDGVMAIDDLSITIRKGEVTGIIGPNGSGKSTLINVLTGLLRMDRGHVVLDSGARLEKIKSFDLPAYGITRTFQEVRLFEQMTVMDNILVVLTERNIFSSIFERHGAFHLKQAEDALKKTGLWEKRAELAINLSYGQRKLLEVSRVLAVTSIGCGNVILFDEPFAGLFPKMVETLSAIIRTLKQEGRAVVLIEHNMEIIRRLSDRVIVMDSGSLLAEGDPKEALERRDVIEAYLGE